MVCPDHSTPKNTSTKSEEQILLNKVAKGDHDSFWQLWKLYRDYLYARCRVWMRENHDDVNEVMSVVVLKVWDKLPIYAPNITNLKGWLNRLTHNLCIDIHRQRKREAVSTDNLDDRQFYIHAIGTSSSNQPESALLQQELKLYLRYGIETLPSRLRHPLILHYYQEMSYVDVAQELSISQDNVSKRLQQAREILKKHLCRYFSGSNMTAIDDAQFQKLVQKDFQIPIHRESNVEEINDRMALPCLETLPPVWCNFHHALNWL